MSSPYCGPENIVLCLDACEELRAPLYPVRQRGSNLSPFNLTKQCVELFLKHKSSLNPQHKFSLVVFKQRGSEKMYGPTNKINLLLQPLRLLMPETPNPGVPYQLSYIFQTIWDKLTKNCNAPPAPLRIIIFYSRSTLCTMDSNILRGYQGLMTDLLFIHRRNVSQREAVQSEVTFRELQRCLDGNSYSFAVCSGDEAFKSIGRLLVHPDIRQPLV